jgi:hypothetical protein
VHERASRPLPIGEGHPGKHQGDLPPPRAISGRLRLVRTAGPHPASNLLLSRQCQGLLRRLFATLLTRLYIRESLRHREPVTPAIHPRFIPSESTSLIGRTSFDCVTRPRCRTSLRTQHTYYVVGRRESGGTGVRL